jgi:chaperone required for assembly of F1-ATPase
MLTKAKSVSAEKRRRFYKTAETAAAEGGFHVLLDGRPIRTPEGGRMLLPTLALAGLVADEWAAQGEHIDLGTMTATRLAFTALDRAPAVRVEVADDVARYAGSDVISYFAEAPEALVAREQAEWTPLLEWARRELGVGLRPVAGIIHQDQPQAAVDRVRDLALEHDDFRLTGLANAAGLLGSAVLALALARGRLAGEQAFELSRLDEAFQEERWGIDEDAAARTDGLRAEARVLDRWFKSLG